MKKYFFVFFIAAIVLTATSCIKDTGNYRYHEINTIVIGGIDTAKGFQVYFNDTLKIAPTLAFSLDKDGTGNYSYKWAMSIGTNPKNGAEIDSTISTNKDLSAKIEARPGSYRLYYYVTDNNTGLTYQLGTHLNVVSQVYEGYLLLNNVDGQSRLDMLSYNNSTNSFTQYIDVLKLEGSTVPMNGMPYQVYCSLYLESTTSSNDYGIFILNSAGGNRIDQETFAWDSTMNVRNLFIGNLPANFAPVHILAEGTLGYTAYPSLYMFDDKGNVYNYCVFSGSAFRYNPLNVYSASGDPFNVAPFGVTTGTTAAFYNIDKKSFVSVASYNSVFMTDAATGYNYPTGYDMVYMDKDYNNNAFAILKDASANFYLLRFPVGGIQTYFQQITGTDIAGATHFAMSPTFGYLFYSVGSKVYEYDPSLKTSILMIDKGASDNITYLNFNHFFNRATSANYATWADYLEVASYGSSPTSGTFELYNVPPINGQIRLAPGCSWTGFGDIVSVTYRER